MPADPGRVQAIFWAAVQVSDPSSRDRFVDRECGDDAVLRQRVTELLRAHDTAGGFLRRTLVGRWVLGAPDDDPSAPE